MKGKVIIFSAPSGAGKTTIVHRLISVMPNLEFSVSATNREPRDKEKHGVDYIFLNDEEFKTCIAKNEFIEWEEVYPTRYYGTLRSEIDRIWSNSNHVVFEVDVKGGINLKRIFGNNALAIFISPPSINVLKERLITRGTEDKKSLKARLEKAAIEMAFSNKFDKIIVNDNLDKAVNDVKQACEEFLNKTE